MESPRFILLKTVLPILFAVLLIACNGTNSREQKEIETKDVFLSSDEIHEGWYFAAGDHIVIEGIINGDAYIAGRLIEIDGTINGDLLVAGRKININGIISDDVRAAGELIHIKGRVGNNVTAFGRDITFSKSAKINGNALSAGMNVQIAGTINKNVRVAAKSMSMRGTIDGDVDFAGNDLSIHEDAKIGGNLNVRIEDAEDVEIADGTVLGKINISVKEEVPPQRILGFQSGHFKFKILWALSLILTALFFVFMLPKQIVGVGSSIVQVPGKAFLWGLIGLIIVPFGIVLLLISIVALPLGFFLLALYLCILYLSQLSLGIIVGDWLFGLEDKSGWNLFWPITVGLLIIQAITFVPYIRMFFILGGLVLGFGAIFLILKNEFQKAFSE